jgi:hypothetical protein
MTDKTNLGRGLIDSVKRVSFFTKCRMLLYHPVNLLSIEIKILDRDPFHADTKYLYGLFPFGMDLVIILTFKTLSYKNAVNAIPSSYQSGVQERWRLASVAF